MVCFSYLHARFMSGLEIELALDVSQFALDLAHGHLVDPCALKIAYLLFQLANFVFEQSILDGQQVKLVVEVDESMRVQSVLRKNKDRTY